MRRAAFIAFCLGCGPSFQAVYEGDARFEHCYALEETSNVSMQTKAECWRQWTQLHTYGQTRDRVEYAASRYHALVNPELPTDEAMMQAAPGMVDTSKQLAAPAPTSAFAPPPVTNVNNTAPPPTQAAPAPPAPSASVSKPTSKIRQCVDECDAAFDACMSQGGNESKCDGLYKACASPCLKSKEGK